MCRHSTDIPNEQLKLEVSKSQVRKTYQLSYQNVALCTLHCTASLTSSTKVER